MPLLFRTQQGGRDLEWHVNASHIVEWCDPTQIQTGVNRGREE